MPKYLRSNGTGDYVLLASQISIATAQDFAIEFEIQSDGGAAFGVRIHASNTGTNRTIIPKGANPTVTMPGGTVSTSGGADIINKQVWRIERSSNVISLTVNGIPQATTNSNSVSMFIGQILDDSKGTTGTKNPCNLYYLKVYKNGVLTNHYDPSSSSGTTLVDVVSGNNGTLTNFAPDAFVDYGASTPVSFSGTVPTQNAVVGTPFSLDLATYFSGTLTPFTYSIFSGALPEDWTLSGSVISGTSAAPDSVTIVARATDTGGNTANTNSFDIVVNWAAVPAGTVTLGTITKTSTTATVPYTYSAADQTGFEYRLNGGSPVADAASPVDLTGLTPSTAYTIEVRAVNASGAGTWSAVGNFTTNAAAQVPQGTVTIGSITTTQTTASVPYTYSASDFDTIEYRIDGGAAVTASASPQSVTGLTAGTTYGIEFRAVNAFGNGAWSTSAPFTTAAVPVGTITLIDLADNTTTLWGNLSGINCIVMNEAATSIVVAKTGLTSDADGDVTFNDAAITAGAWYTVVIVSGTNRGIIRIQAT